MTGELFRKVESLKFHNRFSKDSLKSTIGLAILLINLRPTPFFSVSSWVHFTLVNSEQSSLGHCTQFYQPLSTYAVVPILNFERSAMSATMIHACTSLVPRSVNSLTAKKHVLLHISIPYLCAVISISYFPFIFAVYFLGVPR